MSKRKTVWWVITTQVTIFSAIIIVFFAGAIRDDIGIIPYLKLAQKKQLDCIGMVTDEHFKFAGGSCVLVCHQYVLTAAHLVILQEFNKTGRTIYCAFNDENHRVVSVCPKEYR